MPQNLRCVRAVGSESLPRGIVSVTTDLDMRPRWGRPKKKSKSPINLLAIAVGIKQKKNVNQMVKKFPLTDFAIMLFHYDGNVDAWKEFKWSNNAIHVSTINQTKWWFAKRFLHQMLLHDMPIFFFGTRILDLKIFMLNGISQLLKKKAYRFHSQQLILRNQRRTINLHGPGRRCYEDSTGPPCTGFVEMMAPVFSRESRRCARYMIQNDLVHAWGLDFQLGYCAQGNRTKNIGIVDSEYVFHYGIPTLGGSSDKANSEDGGQSSLTKVSPEKGQKVASETDQPEGRTAVRKESFIELKNFKNRWKKAVREDGCWVDPF